MGFSFATLFCPYLTLYVKEVVKNKTLSILHYALDGSKELSMVFFQEIQATHSQSTWWPHTWQHKHLLKRVSAEHVFSLNKHLESWKGSFNFFTLELDVHQNITACSVLHNIGIEKGDTTVSSDCRKLSPANCQWPCSPCKNRGHFQTDCDYQWFLLRIHQRFFRSPESLRWPIAMGWRRHQLTSWPNLVCSILRNLKFHISPPQGEVILG